MVLFHEFLFTLAISLLLFFTLFKLVHSHNRIHHQFNSTRQALSYNPKNDHDTRIGYVEDLIRNDDPVGQNDVVGAAASTEKMKEYEDLLVSNEGCETHVEQNVGGEQLLCDNSCMTPKFREIEIEIESECSPEEISVKPDFREIETISSDQEHGVGNRNKEVEIDDEDDELEDWEGIERTDLERLFGSAVVFVDLKKKNDECVLDNEVMMQLYGLHKLVTDGPCYQPQPMPFKFSARAKWSYWHRLGDMSREKAMEQYVDLVSRRVADWEKDKTDGNNELISQDVATSQKS